MCSLAPIHAQVDRIEAEKLKAVGLRNRVAALEEVRSPASLNPVLAENWWVLFVFWHRSAAGNRRIRNVCLPRSKKSWSGEHSIIVNTACLDFSLNDLLSCRLQMEELSLTKVMAEQGQLIAKLSDSSSGAAFSF